ncbi:MAG: LPS-assembly protein LptD [Flavobacteriales bacterium]|nr:LPS-assembly protein LptD [Flavobacteriales bacterium]
MTVPNDMALGQTDSLQVTGTLVNGGDTTTIVSEDFGIREQIYYDSSDSTVMDLATETIFLYGNAVVRYGERELNAAYIRYSFADGVAFAAGIPDSTGLLQGKPIFKDGDMEFVQDSLLYNFKTSKGISYGATTREGEAYLHTAVSKRGEFGWVNIGGGQFTTCDHDPPHYHFRLSRAIVVPDDKVVSGPFYMKVGKVPTPLALPFGYFPNRRESAHGILLPGYGNGQERGYFLKGLGYYIPLPPYLDTQIKFDIYSRGSWRVNNTTRYNRNYKYSGKLDLSYSVTKSGIEELAEFSRTKDFLVKWNHNQNAKARPGRQFSANVSLGTSDNYRNNLSSSRDEFLNSTLSSAIRYSRTWNDRPFLLDITARHSQNTQNRSVDILLPAISFGVNRINLPLGFLTGNALMREKLNNKLGVTYNVRLENAVSGGDSIFALNQAETLLRRAENGIQHSANSSSSFKLLNGVITLNPSVSANWFNAFRTVRQTTDAEGVTKLDTLPEFAQAFRWNAGVTANTRIYGLYSFKGENYLKALRHSIQLSGGLNYQPFANEEQSVLLGSDTIPTAFNRFDAARFRPGNSIETGNLNFGINQNLEAKIRDKSSAKVQYKKVTLIDGFRASLRRNLLADSLKWSNVSFDGFTTIAKRINLSYASSYSLYDRNEQGRRIDTYLYESGKGLARMEATSLSVGTTWAGGTGQRQEPEQNDKNPSGNNPWQVRMNYSVQFDNQFSTFSQRDSLIVGQHGLDATIKFTLFERWTLGVDTGYDFVKEELSTTQLNFYWDLHCWEFTAMWIPFGTWKSYMVQLNIKASMLQDLKLQQRGNYSESNF